MIIGGILILACIGLAAKGEWGPAAVLGVIAIFVIICWNAEKLDTKAWYNRTRYWADYDPDEEERW